MRSFSLPLVSVLLTLFGVFTGCDDEAGTGGGATTSSSTTTGAGGEGATGLGGAGGGGGMTPDPTAICTDLGLDALPFSAGPYGAHRGDVAEGFSVALADGSTWSFEERFSGCESYVFSTDRMPVSDADPTSVWESDLDALVAASPPNVHYFFFSRQVTDDDANASIAAMQGRVDTLLAGLPAEDAAHWKARLHVIGTRAQNLDGWLGSALTTHGRIGMGIDRSQRIRGGGYLADVDRYSSQLAANDMWPWKNNLAYTAHEALYFNAQHDKLAHLADPTNTVVTLFDGETLSEFAETTVELPSAAEMEGFDTMEVEVEMACPDPDEVEIGNCGAWDYLAYLFVKDEQGNDVQLARFITSYHRESHWVVDATPMMAHLLAGGTRTFKWSFAPPWNPQPTATKLRLHFSNQGKSVKPRAVTFLYSGGVFDATYNDTKLPMDVAIPAEAARVELWAIITGHGAEAGQCAEFCNHEHEFTIDGQIYSKDFPEAGTEDQCIPQMEHGMVPNQAGTWWFGRGGWCPGQQVEPYVVDVTADVIPGATSTVSYRGLRNGVTPTVASGNIDLVSYLVVYE